MADNIKKSVESNKGEEEEQQKSLSPDDLTKTVKSLETLVNKNQEQILKSQHEDDDDADEENDKKRRRRKIEDDEEEKSLSSKIAEDDDMQKAFEVSDFLKSFSGTVVSAIEGLKDTISKSLNNQNKANDLMVKSMEGLSKRLEAIEDSPVAPKARLSVMEKAFSESEAPTLTKSQMLNCMVDMIQKGEGGLTELDLLNYESSNFIKPGIQQAVTSRIMGNKQIN